MMRALACLAIALLSTAPTAAFAPAREAAPTLRAIADMPSARAAHSATRLADGRVLVAGGCRSDGCEEGLSADALLFDPAIGTFTTTGAPKLPRAGHRAVPLKDGSVLIIGGWTRDGVTASIERYRPERGVFEPFGNLRAARDGFSATVLADGTILIAGGYGDGMRRLASAERFDPRTKTSRTVGAMATPRMSHTATRLADGRVLVAGGSDARGTVTASLELFDPAKGRFSPAGTLEKARHKHAAIRVGPDVLILGGAAIPETDGHFSDSERWKASTGTVSPGPDMREGRYKFLDSVAPLADGRTLVAGSGQRAELLSADGSAFAPVNARIGRKLAFATATTLADGRVLVLGGYDPAIRVDHGAWMFE